MKSEKTKKDESIMTLGLSLMFCYLIGILFMGFWPLGIPAFCLMLVLIGRVRA